MVPDNPSPYSEKNETKMNTAGPVGKRNTHTCYNPKPHTRPSAYPSRFTGLDTLDHVHAWALQTAKEERG